MSTPNPSPSTRGPFAPWGLLVPDLDTITGYSMVHLCDGCADSFYRLVEGKIVPELTAMTDDADCPEVQIATADDLVEGDHCAGCDPVCTTIWDGTQWLSTISNDLAQVNDEDALDPTLRTIELVRGGYVQVLA